MEVLVLGTGGPRGWPEPGCSCASCCSAVRSGTGRAPTSVLVDGALLLDGFGGVERVAAQAGRDLREVRQVLLGAPPPGPPWWLHAVGAASVQVLGTPAALEGLGTSDDRLRLLPVTAGGQHTSPSGHHLRAVPQGAGLAWAVTGPTGGRLLHAPGRGTLGPERTQVPYDLVLLGLAPGRSGDRGAAAELARLRRDGGVGPSTVVHVVGYEHGTDPPDVQRHHLTAWGAEGTEDGTVLQSDRAVPGRPARAGRTLVLGGARSGKSALAEQLLAAHPHVTYVATGGTRAGDAEWRQRVEAHRARRPATWRTVETTDLTACLHGADGALLIDCLGTWLTALLDQHGVWNGGSLEPVEAATEELLAAWRAARHPLVAVSNEVGSGVVPATPSGRLFRDLLGRLNAQVAAQSETVLLTVAGIPVPLREPAGP